MAELVTFDPVDAIAAGALGTPGSRSFLVQARKGDARITVLVEKEQVGMLAAEASAFLDRIDEQYPAAGSNPAPHPTETEVREPAEPLFRARAIGIGFDPARNIVMVELREFAEEDDDEDEDEGGETPLDDPPEGEGWVARLFATKEQVRAMAAAGLAAVAGGRPACPLCDMPMDPDGHRCPRWN